MAEALLIGAWDEEKATTPSGGYDPGDIVLGASGRPGVIQGQRPLEEGEPAVLVTSGKYAVAAASATTFAAGAIVGFNNTTKLAVAAGTGTFDIGTAAAAKTSGQTSVQVLLNEGLSLRKGLDNAIADPGDGEAIPVTSSGHIAIVTAGDETNTLDDPTFVGQELLLYIKTDGGTRVITAASAINQTGNNTITMAEVRDSIRLQAIESGSSLVWDVVANNGAALSTV